MARFDTANAIINRAAVELGLVRDADPVASSDASFISLTELLNAAGQELVEAHEWNSLVKSHQIVTQDTDTGQYDLPEDFSYMIDQTGWEHSNRSPLAGPLSAQDWTYLAGRDLVSTTIYASFRQFDTKFNIYPQDPVPAGLDINFEYISRFWVLETTSPEVRKDLVTVGSDIVLYEPILVIKLLKVKFLEAKGFDSSAAANDFVRVFGSRTGKDTGAPILSAGRGTRGFPYLDPYSNTADSHYGDWNA
jgi:hypothetical protein